MRTTSRHVFLAAAVAITILAATLAATAGDPGTPADRLALLDYVVAKTIERTAWSPFTVGRPEQHFVTAAAGLKSEFEHADTDAKLFLALTKLSNLRHDRHLSVNTVEGGIAPERFSLQAPVQFRADYGKAPSYTLFVADYDTRIKDLATGGVPEIGDVLTAVNGIPVDRYAAMMAPYIRHSTADKLWWETASAISQKSWRFGPELYRDDITYALRRANGEAYNLTVRYIAPDAVRWSGFSAKVYRGFTKALETPTFTLHVASAPRKVLILDWKSFGASATADTDRLMAFASAQGLLDHDIFFDGTTAGGGARGAYVLARLSSRPFKTTFGNLRISDVTEPFIREVQAARRGGGVSEAADAGARLIEWLENDVRAAARAGRPYSPNVPFKLAELPKDSDGTMKPASVHFRGRLVCAFSSFGGSHLDQFAAMVIDNDIGYTVGMPAGGYSNTWEWTETLRFASSGRPVASFMWNIGHTLRPNGQILEGNAALPREPLPMTRENSRTYYDRLLDRVFAYLDRPAGTAESGHGRPVTTDGSGR